ncbi:MAG: filamentous hemagglutinin, partial [Comamonadaceae bacterium]|nr:filamentous hemagglutinin [Comamonadaceae bacterium]
VRLASKTSVIYTAGRVADPLSDYRNPSGPNNVRNPNAFFTQDGGDIHIEARGHVTGVRSTQLYSEWLWRTGRVAEDDRTYLPVAPEQGNNTQLNQGQTAWWVRFDQFQQGVGTLGGGDVSVVAGGDVQDLSASAPTQGRMNSPVADLGKLVKTGGGDVRVEAGQDVLGGQYFADEGNVILRAGRDLGSGTQVGASDLYPVLALGNGEARVNAHADLNIQAVINPTLLHQSAGISNAVANIQGAATEIRKAVFSTYGQDSGVALESLTGDVVLSQFGVGGVEISSAYDLFTDAVKPYLGVTNIDLPGQLNWLPPSMSMTAFEGSVNLNGGTRTLLPSPAGQLELLAMNAVRFGSSQLVISDRDPATIPSAARPVQYVGAGIEALTLSGGRLHATTPVHTGGSSTARVYAVQGDVIAWEGSDVKTGTSLTSAKAVSVRAGGDVADFNLRIQHANASDRSLVQAGRDVYFTPTATRTEEAGIRIGGLGTLEVSAGRDLSLGASGGILSRGDLDNNNLPVGGASIQVMAGVGANGLDAAGTLQRLAERVASGTVSDTDLWLVRWLVGNDGLSAADAAAALAGVRALGAQTQRDQVRDMLFTALRATGRAANVADSGYAGQFDRGYAALELAFPGIGDKDANGEFTRYQGSINLFASRINTARGGDIHFLVPGGDMVVGLANTPDALTKLDSANSPGPLGVVASASGDIKGFSRGDVLVNQSRILTVGGGDILLWSSEGDLDAGKGKKTATSVPPPVIRIDAQGNVTLELQGAATGSGIGALKTGDTEAGDVDLIAPRGTVNAGDAGIRAGNLNIAALVVLGADNISVSGTSAGTPVADTSAVTAAASGATTGGDDSSSVVESLNQAAAESAKAAQELAEALRPFVVRVEVLGYGD